MTQPPNHVADELRRIADAPADIPPAYRDRLRMLAAEVAAEPATAELEAIHTGLSAEQEIRARAVATAARSEARFGWELLEIAERYAAWIRTGTRQGSELESACTCEPHPTRAYIKVGAQDCPEHGGPA